MPYSNHPSQSVLEAFAIKHPLQPLPGGRGLCFLADDVVLRPVDEIAETEWLSSLLYQINKTPSHEYRVAWPLRSRNASQSLPSSEFIADGWTASSFLHGKDGPKHKWSQLFDASRAFHRHLKELVHEPPTFLDCRTDRWAQADRVTWEEKRLEEIPEVNYIVLDMINPYLRRLEAVKKPLPEDILVCQLIHGDLTGNVLFDVEGQDLSPAIIDISPYWRPVEYTEAIVVADGLLDHGQGIELVHLFGVDEFRLQLLVRALYWRILTYAIQSDMSWLETHLPGIDFDGAISLVSGMFATSGLTPS